MKKAAVGFLFCLTCLIVPAFLRAGVTGNVNLFGGQKSLASEWVSTIEPSPGITEQREAGILFDIRPMSLPVNIALDLFQAKSESRGVSVKTGELDFGYRKYFGDSASGTPYMGGGLARIKANVTDLTISNKEIVDAAMGYWVEGGIVFNPLACVNLGMDVRYSQAEVKLHQDIYRNGGGIHMGVTLGFKF